MNEPIESSNFLDNKNPIEFLMQQDPLGNSINNLFDESDDEETREFLMLEQTLQQENDEEPLFNILRKQVEQISITINDQQERNNADSNLKKSEDEENLNSMNLTSLNNLNDQKSNVSNQIILRPKKKISFDENSYDNEKKTSNQIGDNQEVKGNRPLTIFIPNTKQDLDLINHLTALGHDLESFKQHVQLTPTICMGYLWKECSSSENNWRKRYFCFDLSSKFLMYFKSLKHYFKHKEPKDAVRFEEIKNVYPDHIRNLEKILPKYYANFTRKSRSIFIVKTNKKDFVLSTFSPELMRLWIDVIWCGAEAYENFF